MKNPAVASTFWPENG